MAEGADGRDAPGPPPGPPSGPAIDAGRAAGPETPCLVCGSADPAPLLRVLSRRMVRCRRCGLIYRSPGGAEPALPTSEPAAPADVAAEERVGARRAGHFERFLARAGRPGRLLDVGCGYGFFLGRARARGWQVSGVDVDPRAIAYARDRLGVDARPGPLEDLRLPPGAFDLVTLWNVVECATEPLGLLQEVHRVAKPGGIVFVRTQNVAWHLQSFRAVRLLGRLGLGGLLGQRPYAAFIFNRSSFSRRTLRLLLERAGFTDVRVRNSLPILGDPYLGVSRPAERLLTASKLAVHGAAQGVALLSGGRGLIGPSIEARARRPG